MPVKTFKCAKCGDEVTKRKSRLVGDERICKHHDEAIEFAEKDRVEFIGKMLKQRQEHKRNTREPRRIDPISQLASFAVLGSMYRQQEVERVKRDLMAREMLDCAFKSKIIEFFLDNAAKGLDRKDLINETGKVYNELSERVLSTIDNVNDRAILTDLMMESYLGMPENLADRLYADVTKFTAEVIDEWKAFDKRHDELQNILNPK